MVKFKQRIKSIFLTTLIVIGAIIMSVSPVAANGRNQYYLSFLYNPDSKTFGSFVAQNSGVSKMENVYSMLNTNKSSFQLNYASSGPANVRVEGLMKSSPHEFLTYYPFTFPEFTDVDGSSADYAMAAGVGSGLTRAFNTAIAHILKPVSVAGRKELGIDDAPNFFRLSAAIANSGHAAINGGDPNKIYSYGKLQWKIRQASENDMKSIRGIPAGSSTTDYVVITNRASSGNSWGTEVVVPYLYPKGYSAGQDLYGQQQTSADHAQITSKLSWSHVVYLSGAHFSKGGTVQNPGTVNKEDALSKLLSGFISSLVGAFTGMLGMQTVEELMFNAGTRGSTYYFGTMPMSWLQPVSTLNLVASVVSLIVIGVSILRILIKRNMASITPSVKADLMEGLKDMFIVALGVLLFMPFLYILLRFNNTIVEALRNLSPSGSSLGMTKGAGFYGIGEAFFQLIFVFILLMLNITYIIRAITLAMLIGFAPFFISLFGAGAASKKISFVWVKELLSNIFMQSFNAAMLLVFASIGAYGSLSLMERLALLISFIPLTKFFKSGLMNLGSGTDAVGEKTGGAFTNLATAFAAGTVLSKYDGKVEKDGKMVSDKKNSSVDGVSGTGIQTGRSTTAPSIENNPQSSGFDSKDKLKGGLENSREAAGKAIGEARRMAGKVAMVGAGAGVSLGSAAVGGSPLAGKAAMIGATKSMSNQVQGWMQPVDESPITMQGNELQEYGVKGIDNDKVIFSNDVRESVNEDQSQFLERIDSHNTVNPEDRMEAIYNDKGDTIVGARVSGIAGKTVSMKDPETNKVISSESTILGVQKLDKIKPVLIKNDSARGSSSPPQGKGSGNANSEPPITKKSSTESRRPENEAKEYWEQTFPKR